MFLNLSGRVEKKDEMLIPDMTYPADHRPTHDPCSELKHDFSEQTLSQECGDDKFCRHDICVTNRLAIGRNTHNVYDDYKKLDKLLST